MPRRKKQGCKDCLERISTGKVLLRGIRENRVYKVDPSFVPEEDLYLPFIKSDTGLWHKRFGHTSLKTLAKLHNKDLVRGLPKVESHIDEVCVACARGKQVRPSFKSKKDISTSNPLELIHMDLCGPMRT